MSLSGYLESLEAHNAAVDPASNKPEPSEWLRNRVNAAVN